MGFTGVRGGFIEPRLRSGFIGGGFSGLILCCFYSKLRDENKEGGMHSGWWVCIGSGDSAQLQLLRVAINIQNLKKIKNVDRRQGYIYIYAVKLLSGPSLGVFGSYYLVQVGFLDVIIWSKFVFLAYKNSGFKRFGLHTQLSFCVFFWCPIFWQFSKNSLFQKKGAKIGFFNFQCFKFKFWKFSFFRFAKTL